MKWSNVFWLIISIAVWGIVHSVLASLGFKNLLRRTAGDGFMKFYRLLYNVFSVVSLLPVLYLMIALPDASLYQAAAPWSYLLRFGQGLSTLLLFIGVLQTDVLSFVGLRQLIGKAEENRLITTGLYRLVRHPLYTFGLLVLWLSPSQTVNSFVVCLAFTMYILVGAVFEERKLLREFGREYTEYKSVTPMLIPGLSKISRSRGNLAGTNHFTDPS